MQEKFSADVPQGMPLNQKDIASIKEEASYVTHLNESLWKTLLCVKLCSKKHQRMIGLKEKALDRFESQLDIRSFVKMHVDLALLSMILLNKP